MSNQRRKLPFVQLDVFTSHPLEGNQLAVFPDARGLSDDQMQALAREINLSETTFVFPDESSGGAVKVRIFTVQEELPFAGHPTLGTAFALRSADAAKPAKVTLELKVGKVPVEFSRRDGMEFGEMRQREPEF